MQKTDSEFDELDALLNNHPINYVPEGFPGRVMQRIEMQAPWMMFWEGTLGAMERCRYQAGIYAWAVAQLYLQRLVSG